MRIGRDVLVRARRRRVSLPLTSEKRRVMILAREIYRSENVTWSQALKKAWKRVKEE